MSTFLLDSRSRASHWMIGTSADRDSALRTCSTECRGPPKSFTATMKDMPWCSRRSMAYQESATRRVSTRTTTPRVPENSRSQRNQNRSCPGAPNRYSTISSFSVMRPKSKATVVVVLVSTPPASSIPTPAWVMISSVLSGRISLTARTRVVFPTPNPPTTTIFKALLAVLRRGARTIWSELFESNEHLLQDGRIGQPGRGGGRGRVARGDAAGVEEVTKKDLDDTDGKPEFGGDLHDGGGPAGHPEDLHVLGLHARRRIAFAHDQRDQVEPALVGTAAAAGDGVQPVGVLPVERPGAHAGRCSGWRGAAGRCSPSC